MVYLFSPRKVPIQMWPSASSAKAFTRWLDSLSETATLSDGGVTGAWRMPVQEDTSRAKKTKCFIFIPL